MIQVYTGEGKGKTTAALGLALRAAGAGLKVYIGQFIKGKTQSEIKALKQFRNIKIEQYGRGRFISSQADIKDIILAKSGLNKARDIIASKKYRLVILDEINIALHCRLLSLKEVLKLIKTTPKSIELILTGRYAHPQVIKSADLVSEVREIKHYYKKGVKARKGIEA